MICKLKYSGALLVAMGLLLHSCGDLTAKEIARVPVNKYDPSGFGQKYTRVSLLQNDNIAIWTDIDMDYKGPVDLAMTLEIYKSNDELYKRIEFSPFEKTITKNEVKLTANGRTQWKFSGKNAEIKVEQAGMYKFVATLRTSMNSTLKMKQPQVVLKRKG